MLIASSRQAKTNRLLAAFCGVSFVAHVAFVIVYAVIAFAPDRGPPIEPNVVKTRLVKLGKQRDENLLPRIAKSAPPPKVDKGPELPAPPKEDEPTPEPEAEPEPSAQDILEKFAEDNERPDLNSLISDRLGEPVDEGHEQGHKLGDAITGKLKADYNDILHAKISNAYKLPQTLTDQERIELRAVLYVHIGAEGQLLDVKVNPSSGNSAFDSAVLAAAKKAAPFDPPPLQLRGFYADGVGFNMCPISCK